MDTAPIVQVDNLAYRYPQRVDGRGLQVEALAIRAGEAVLISGPSGCGKSTLARCLTGLIPNLYRGHMGGRVVVDELDTARAPLWQLSERVGMVFQNPASQMLSSSVEGEIVFGLENMGLSRRQIDDRLEGALARFGLQALRARSPLALSGG